jgi:hypothetical protein
MFQRIVTTAKNNKGFTAVVIVVIIIVVAYFAVYGVKSGFNSAAGIVARRAQHQVRDDTQASADWDLGKLEKAVELINRT